MSAALAAALAAFDEAALATLANKGLVRRAARDVEEGKVALVGVEGGSATVSADGETVTIDAGGPARARCSCPAPGVCRHRIAAVLLLQAGMEASAPAEDPTPALLAEVAAIPEAELRRFAGKAGWRAALEMADAGAEVRAEGSALAIRLAGEESEIRYLPGLGVEGMVSKLAPAKRKAGHAAALIAARRAGGVEPEAAAEPVAASEAEVSADPGFLAEVRDALAEACRSALSLAPLALEERLFTLSVSSRADALPRLGAMLRGIARMVRERRARDFRFDPDHCLGRIAEADALARALAVVEDPDRRRALAGAVRQDYAEWGPLTLRGMGAEAWKSEGGARGVTGYFYDSQADRWFTASLSRGAGQDPWFEPRKAYANEALWGGTALTRLVRSDVTLEGASASATGRLSAGAGVRARATPAHGPVPPDWPCVFAHWHALEERLRHRLTGTLSAPAPASEPVVLQPRRTARPFFDDLSQTLHCPVEDAHGQWLALSIAHDPDTEARTDALAAKLEAGARTILARAAIAGASYRIEPIALDAGDALWCVSVDAVPAAPKRVSGLLAMLRNRGEFGFAPRPLTGRLIEELRTEAASLAETGCRLRSEAADRRLEVLAARAGGAGLAEAEAAIARVRSADPVGLAPAVLAARFTLDQLHDRLVSLPLLARG